MYYQVSGRARDHPTVSYINFPLCPFSHWYYRASVDTALPLGQPIVGVDGQDVHLVFVPKGTTIILDLSGVNTDKDIWGEDGEVWKPDRWLNGVPQRVVDSRIPSVYSQLCVFRHNARL